MADFTLDSFAEMLMAIGSMEIAEHAALQAAGEIVQKEAKDEIGSYQGAAGPFAAWSPLAASTIDDRVHQGFSPDDPLLRTGDMRDSIGVVVDGHEAYVGSNDDKAVWQELGTSKGIPPRSFLGGAAVRKSKEVSEVIGREMVAALIGEQALIPIT